MDTIRTSFLLAFEWCLVPLQCLWALIVQSPGRCGKGYKPVSLTLIHFCFCFHVHSNLLCVGNAEYCAATMPHERRRLKLDTSLERIVNFLRTSWRLESSPRSAQTPTPFLPLLVSKESHSVCLVWITILTRIPTAGRAATATVTTFYFLPGMEPNCSASKMPCAV